ncbi:hypothetical protein NEIMUCOT_05401 [Neisseria mucosa ATCC 25996]|uniref:Uncharacterized protein n=1 Tax=Neisseria mucosa (strain ATCC 25996 / DSM 4631 / NCTC 10774 / M26) TaxID=546266 RepID=D2ZXP7_NEIM2|nr:hypothetical protein NEIMUCOT_05401 [Neisseria mucosa ATCC 25996]
MVGGFGNNGTPLILDADCRIVGLWRGLCPRKTAWTIVWFGI